MCLCVCVFCLYVHQSTCAVSSNRFVPYTESFMIAHTVSDTPKWFSVVSLLFCLSHTHIHIRFTCDCVYECFLSIARATRTIPIKRKIEEDRLKKEENSNRNRKKTYFHIWMSSSWFFSCYCCWWKREVICTFFVIDVHSSTTWILVQ